MPTTKLSTYRKNVKAHLVEGLVASGYTQNSDSSFQKIAADFCTYTVTLHDTHYTMLVRERSLKDGWTENRSAYTYLAVQKLLGQH